ncbi:MAG: ABC transporter permease [Alphaproteobacteria bacterium]|nr:ABC transporter permease [Alphaproteobacteria bacterium]
MIRAILLVARREYIAYVTAWGFWLGLILTPLGLVVGVVLPGVIARAAPVHYYTVVDDRPEFATALSHELEDRRADAARTLLSTALASETKEQREATLNAFTAARLSGLDAASALEKVNAPVSVEAPDRRYYGIEPPARTLTTLQPFLSGEKMLAGPAGDKPLFAALIVSRNAAGKITEVGYWSEDVVDSDLSSAAGDALRTLARTKVLEAAGVDPASIDRAELDLPTVVSRKVGKAGEASEVSSADRAPYFAAAAIAFLLWLLVFSIVNFLIMGTIEERSNKIFDTLLTSVRLSELLAGKLIGVFALSVTLMGAWALFAAAMIARSGDPAFLTFAAAALDPTLVVAALAGFVAGYLMYAAIFLALGSLCDTIQEAQSLMSPLIILLMIPIFVIAIALRHPALPWVEALAWFPPFTPFLMILRAPLHPPLWEMLGQTVLMVASAGLVLSVSVRIYREGAVNGASIGQILGWMSRKRRA